MTKVDFYILEDNQRDLFVCRLVEKIYTQGKTVYIHTEGDEQSRNIDQLLWSFREGSFIPHHSDCDRGDHQQSPVEIGSGEVGDHHNEVLINLTAEVPLIFSRFERVAEIISERESDRNLGRERFRFYRDRGYPLQSHNIKAG
ncbi:MAG: DNA polymerase III subunit chi [Gammaproteobacteria bacterium]|nr:DNA polymerase III subunit chi [Gammaproteobacteria bacterium]